MDLDQLERFLWICSVLGFLLLGISLLGEYRGWWNAIGEAGITLGSIMGVVAGFGGVAVTASKRQVRQVGRVVGRSEGKVDGIGSQLGRMDGKLDSMDLKLDSMDGKLDKLDKLDHLENLTKLNALDAIQFRLDAQTGVLAQQLDVLTSMRDGR